MSESAFTVKEARRIEKEFYNRSMPSEADVFLYTEAMQFLIAREKNPRDMMNLGGYYYEQKFFDLALKYYEMAASCGYEEADECLGYIWYYGRTGMRDFEKAYQYYSRAMLRGNIVASYKVADMYKNGYYVEKNYEKYTAIIEELYPKVKYASNLWKPLPEIFTRLAGIRKKQGKVKEAVNLLQHAKSFLSKRIKYDAFFGNLSIMSRLIDELYSMTPFDTQNFDFYDLYYLLKNPVGIHFTYKGYVHEIEASMENGICVICFDKNWFRETADFFGRACIGDERLTSIYDELEDFEVK